MNFKKINLVRFIKALIFYNDTFAPYLYRLLLSFFRNLTDLIKFIDLHNNSSYHLLILLTCRTALETLN